ncbi:MAG: deoxyhypusine synthase family protein [Planctomycetes bacterium]|nr:deoxyhypusine synthase family protein [Planctomycetota bacterium]MCB9825218.1 deoxyhypusine synthase family protein [Planctomycetota bacterium]MCB9829417.1 deoxyhypusine synthase family protein [Planctomycetota bacterium]MCB9900203.1 deoxyhypusine synthase family protein [Planctomycetota bacterium]
MGHGHGKHGHDKHGHHGKHAAGDGDARELHDGVGDGLVPLVPLDLATISSADDLVRAMSRTAFAGRSLGEAADVLEAMVRDPECMVVCTLSGAMTIAKMGLVLCDMIEQGWIHAIVSTGALMCHGFVEATGRNHFKHDPHMDDQELYEKGYDRVYDTLELEQSLDDIQLIVDQVLAQMPVDSAFGSADLHARLGRWLVDNVPGRGVLKAAWEHHVPVYVPAFTDSEIGLDVALFQRRSRTEGRAYPIYDGFLDLEAYTAQVIAAPKVGIFTVGGGAPRNWAQQVAPYLEITNHRLGTDLPLRQFGYGIRLCPEPVHWGGLSGCTYEEGVSWGKFVHPRHGGRYSEVLADATVTWPLLIKAVQERMAASPPPPKSFPESPLFAAARR